MKGALIGSTGRIGSRILTELASRGHRVTAIVRDPTILQVDWSLPVKARVGYR
jgi:putative NADH-flavin reductase